MELIAAAQGVWLRETGPERLGRGTAAAYRHLRERVRPLRHDRDLTPDIAAAVELIDEGTLLEAVEDAVGSDAPGAR